MQLWVFKLIGETGGNGFRVLTLMLTRRGGPPSNLQRHTPAVRRRRQLPPTSKMCRRLARRLHSPTCILHIAVQCVRWKKNRMISELATCELFAD